MRIAASFGSLVVVATLGGLAAETAGGTTKTPPLFVFEEGGDTLSFFPPKTVRLVRHLDGSNTKVCETELPDNGNMWSGADVDHAYRNAEVQKALGNTSVPYVAEAAGKLTAGDRTITWAANCNECAQPPTAIKNLYTVVHGVMFNRRLLCK
jgi:hypothetical protein